MHVAIEKMEPRMIVLAMVGVVALTVAVSFKWMMWPQARLYQQSIKERTLLERASTAGGDLAQQLATLEQDVQTLDRRIHGDMANLPEKQLEAFVIGRLQRISTRNNVQLMSVRPRSGESVKMFREALFEINVTGTYFDLFDWLRDLSGELGFVVVRQYAIAPLGDDPANPLLNVSMTVVSYRQADNG